MGRNDLIAPGPKYRCHVGDRVTDDGRGDSAGTISRTRPHYERGIEVDRGHFLSEGIESTQRAAGESAVRLVSSSDTGNDEGATPDPTTEAQVVSAPVHHSATGSGEGTTSGTGDGRRHLGIDEVGDETAVLVDDLDLWFDLEVNSAGDHSGEVEDRGLHALDGRLCVTDEPATSVEVKRRVAGSA